MSDPNITALRIFVHWQNKNKDVLKKYRLSDPDLAIWKNIDRLDKMHGNGETFEASWKCLTINHKLWQTTPMEVDDVKELLNNFLDKRFYRWIYTIEHINTNLHIHIAMEFKRKKLRKGVLITQLRQYFKFEDFDFALKDKKGKDHFKSKTLEQARGYIGYIQKDQEHKIKAVFSDPEFEAIAVKFKN